MPNTIFVAPASRGTGDGSTAANARRYNGSAQDLVWLQGVLTAWVQELVADPTDVGLNETHTINTVKPGFEDGYNDIDENGNPVPVKAYVTDARAGVWARRVCFLTDVGEYQITGTGPWLALPPTCGLPMPVSLDVGKTGQPIIRRIHLVGYRTSDSKRADEVAGSTVTRSVTMPAKSGAQTTWSDTANYATTGGQKLWSGGTTAATKTWTVQLPSPIRAIIRGNRTQDPRTGDKHAQQWSVSLKGTTPMELRDPTSAAVEPWIVDGAARKTITAGQVYDPANNTLTNGPAIVVGPTAVQAAASCIGIQGFEFRDLERPVSFLGTAPCRFLGFYDIRLDNTRYFNFRGDNRYDIDIARMHGTAVAQKALCPGINCQRWHVSDVYLDGQLAVGDRIQSLMASPNGASAAEANAYNAGAFRLQNLILEYMWDAAPTDATYTQGDGIDSEAKGHTIRNLYVDMTGDGGLDNKPTPYWANWPAVSLFNAYLSRNKRAVRSWPSVQDISAVAPHVLRDVTIADARQYGLFLVSTPGHHKFVDWWNPDGRCNFRNPAGRTFVAVSNDGAVGGDMDVVIHQLHDARTGSGGLTAGLNTQDALGGSTAPYRARLRTPITAPRPLKVSVDGSATDDGATIIVPAGQSRTLHPTNLQAGGTVSYRLTGPGAVTLSGVDATITPTLQ